VSRKEGFEKDVEKNQKKIWIDRSSFSTFAAPIKREGKRNERLRISRKKSEKRFGLIETLIVCLPPVSKRRNGGSKIVL
jgi:hypothetical protein